MTRGIIPDGFVLVAPSLTVNQLADRYGVGRTTVWKWCVAKDVKPRRATPSRSIDRSLSRRVVASNDARRDTTRAGLAAAYLQRFCRVFRCDAVGNQLADGFFWCRGRAVLTDDELIARAIQLGWREDEWREERAA